MSAQVFATDEQSDRPVDLGRWVTLAERVLEDRGIGDRTELSLMFVDEKAIAELNERFLGHSGPTDVLSFPIEDELIGPGHVPDQAASGPGRGPAECDELPLLLGDVVICPEIAWKHAPEHAGTYDDEIALLVVHGILHLLGMDHADDDEAAAMEALEQQLLTSHYPRADSVIATTRSFTGADGALLATVFLLVAASAVLSLAETGLTRTSRARAKSLEDSGQRGARSLRRLVEEPETFLAPILLVVLLCQLIAATLVGVVASQLFGPIGVAVATVFEVVVIFVFSEAVPKQWAVRHSDRAALLAAPLVTTLIRFPPTRVVSGALIGLARLITPGGRDKRTEPDVTESELLAFADVAAQDEAIEGDERALIHSIIEFGDTIVREVMVPRPDVVAVEDSAEVGAVLERAIEAGYSRIPVFNQSLDDVVGIAFTKDLILAVRSGKEHNPVSEVARPANYVPETKRVAPLMREMQAGQFHLAVVIDEYGGTAGVVTLEDLIEELVGEIVDEFDVDEPLVEPLGGGQFRVSSKMSVDEVNELLGADLPTGDWDTVGGLVLATSGHVPAEGESIEVDGHLLVAERLQGRRIGSVRILRLEGPPLHTGPKNPDEEWLAERAHRAAERAERSGDRSDREERSEPASSNGAERAEDEHRR